MRIFISQPMKDKTNDEIRRERNELISMLQLKYGADVEIIDSFFENSPHDARPLWFLGKSLELLSTADAVIFAKGWKSARGCRIEHLCCKEYGIKILDINAMGKNDYE